MTKIHWHTSVKNFDIYGINDQPKVEKRSELIDLNKHRNWKFNSNIWPPCISWMISHTLSTCEMGNHWVLTGWGYVWAISFLFHWFKGSKLSNGQLIIHICCFCQTGRLQKKRINNTVDTWQLYLWRSKGIYTIISLIQTFALLLPLNKRFI